MGVIYVPVKKELYFGVHDSGAYKLSGITARDGMSWDELLARKFFPFTMIRHRIFR
jgi:3'(2'), 5'-bisphosphate nucleotidase